MCKLLFGESGQRTLSKQCSAGKLNRFRNGIYTDAPLDKIPQLVSSKWYEIAGYLYDSPVAVFRTADELRPVEGHVFIGANVSQRN